jgi:tripartite-type tricarboxylate transporter receptor subunit TctC
MAHYVARLALGFAWVCTFSAAADDYPSKPIRIIVGFPAGSGGDVVTRELAPAVSERLHQQIIVDNRPGANGNIAMELAARAKPDGLTLVYVVNSVQAVNPHLYGTKTFNAAKDLRPFIACYRVGAIAVVNANSPIRSWGELIATARTKPGGLSYATSGPGSAQHMMGERAKKMAAIDWIAVHYKGEAPAVVDLIGGQVDFAFGFPATYLPHVRSGKLRPLAVTSAKRSPALPNVPTIAESGLAGYDESVWLGYAAPAATPEPMVRKLNEAFRAALTTPEIKNRLEERGSEILASSPERAAEMLKTDYERFGKTIAELGLRPE